MGMDFSDFLRSANHDLSINDKSAKLTRAISENTFEILSLATFGRKTSRLNDHGR